MTRIIMGSGHGKGEKERWETHEHKTTAKSKALKGEMKKTGHSEERIKAIHKEASESSNPDRVYQYWGMKK